MIFNPVVTMDHMRTQVFFLFIVLMFVLVLGSGCIDQVPGDVTYRGGTLTFTIRSEEVIPDGVLEVAVFRLQDYRQVELYRNAEYFPIKTGNNEITIPIELQNGNYRCFIYTRSGTTRFPVVIKDFEI